MENKPTILSGDGQMDYPGHYVIHLELVDVRHCKLKSACMEKVGCERALDVCMEKMTVDELVTDASSQIIKMLGKRAFNQINHSPTALMYKYF